MTITFTTFHFRRVNPENGKVTIEQAGAHFYCETCNINYSNADPAQVNDAAEAHAILHRKRVYVPDAEFFRSMN